MSKKIISVAYNFPGSAEITLPFNSKQSLLDADIVMFSPEKGYNYNIQDGYSSSNGKTVYDQDSSGDLKNDIGHWRREISSYLKAGNTVFFFLKSKDEFYLVNGFHYTGSGRTATKNLHTELYDIYHTLPIDLDDVISAKGKEMKGPLLPLFEKYHERFKDILSYESYVMTNKGKPIYVTKSGNRTLGSVIQVGSGNLVLLPYLDFSDEKYTIYKKGESFWSKEAMDLGNSLIPLLLEIDKNIRADITKTPPPDWVSDQIYSLKSETELKERIKKREESILDLNKEVKGIKEQLTAETSIKDLLYESGKPLENIVTQSLHLLGYTAENYNDGKLELDQIIVSPENIRFIGECEGKENKAIDINKIRQLVDGLNEDLSKDSVQERAIGILFGNPQRFEKPNIRTLTFTDKALRGAEREKIALILTKDLFPIIKYLKENEDEEFKKACRQSIIDNLGKIIIFPSVPKKKEI